MRFSSQRFCQLSYVVLVFLLICESGSGQVFDEKFEHWPVDLKINGTIILHNHSDVSRLKPEVLNRFLPTLRNQNKSKPEDEKDQTAKREAVFLSWNPIAADGQQHLLKAFQLSDSSLFLASENGLPPEADRTIRNAKLVFVVSQPAQEGQFLPKLAKLRESLEAFVDQQGVLVANSSAARLLSKTVVLGKSPHARIGNGLGLVPDSVIETQFESQADERRIRSALASHPRCVGIGITPNTTLILRGRKFFTMGQGSAKFMLAANERQPQRNQTIGVEFPRKNRFDFSANLVDLTEWRRDAIDRTLPPFPVANPQPPVVENGTLVIVGGGGMPANLMQQIIDLAGGKEKARMVYIPCSERDEVSNAQRTVDMWKKMGVKSATFIHTKDRNRSNSDAEFLEPLKHATGLWFGGGRQWNFSDSYYGTEAHKLMKDVLRRNGVIGGSSAGASIQARYLARATPIGNYQIMAPGYERGGLGFISGVAIDQHFTQRGRQKDMTQLMQRHPQLLGIGIDEATAIIVQKSNAKVVGRGRVHFYDRRQAVYPDQPDYVALGAGSEYDLKARKVLIEKQPPQPKKAPSESKSNPQKKQKIKS